jgi:hypothetical protein
MSNLGATYTYVMELLEGLDTDLRPYKHSREWNQISHTTLVRAVQNFSSLKLELLEMSIGSLACHFLVLTWMWTGPIMRFFDPELELLQRVFDKWLSSTLVVVGREGIQLAMNTTFIFENSNYVKFDQNFKINYKHVQYKTTIARYIMKCIFIWYLYYIYLLIVF